MTKEEELEELQEQENEEETSEEIPDWKKEWERKKGLSKETQFDEKKGKVLVWDRDLANDLWERGSFGIFVDKILELDLIEALFLLDLGRIDIEEGKKNMTLQEVWEKAAKIEKDFATNFRVYKEFRNRGFIVRKSDNLNFKVYRRGHGPSADNDNKKVLWYVYCVHEDNPFLFKEMADAVQEACKNKKQLLWAILDDEGDVTYYNIREIMA